MPNDITSMIGNGISGFASGGPIGLAASIVPSIIGLIGGAKQKQQAKLAQQQADQYFNGAQTYANDMLGTAKQGYNLAQHAYNGRMAGAGAMEQNIAANQGNTLGAMGRNATDNSQLLALAGGVQGNTNAAYGNLAQQEAQNKMYQQQFLDMARQGLMGAQNNLQNLNTQRGMMKEQTANQLGQAGQINQFQGAQGLANTGIMAAGGGFGNLFGGGASGGSLSGAALGGIDYTPQLPQVGQVTPQFNYTFPFNNRFQIGG